MSQVNSKAVSGSSKAASRSEEPRELGTPRGLSEAERRAYARIPAEVDFVYHESFDEPDAEASIFGEQAPDIEIPRWTSFPEVADDQVEPAAKGRRARLTAKEEAAMFIRYNYACWRLAKLVEAQLKRATLPRGREMVRWYGRAMKTRAELVRANLALVLAMAKRTKIPNVEFGEVVSEGNMALLRSVEKFDVSRGFKFSTYACRAILKSFNRLATKTGKYRQRFPTEFDPSLERSDYDVRRHEMQREHSIEAVREVLLRNRANLSEVEQTVVMERFALSNRGRKRTLAEVGKTVGLTNERVRQIQNHALGKIRRALTEDYAMA